MKYIITTVLLSFSFSVFSAACRDIPLSTGEDSTRRIQQIGPDNPVTGRNAVYEGAPCPAGNICVEHIGRGGYLYVYHAQTAVINKATGAVVSLLPITTGATASTRRPNIPFSSPTRRRNFCRNMRQDEIDRHNANEPTNPWTLETIPDPCQIIPGEPVPVFDMYAYSRYQDTTCPSGNSAYFSDYCKFSPEARTRAIEVLNSGLGLNPDSWEQNGSVERGGGGTFRGLEATITAARESLGCQPNFQSARDRVFAQIRNQAAEFNGCLNIQDQRDRTLQLLAGDSTTTFTEDVPRAEVQPSSGLRLNDLPPAEAVQLVRTGLRPVSFPGNCVSVQTAADIETVTCQNDQITQIDPNDFTKSRRYGQPSSGETGIYRPQNRVTFRLVNGIVENVNVEQRYTYLSDFSKSCDRKPVVTNPANPAVTPGSVIQQ